MSTPETITADVEAAVRQRLTTIPIFKTLGFQNLRLGPGWCEAFVPRQAAYDGIYETFHGGMMMTVADSLAAAAILTVCGAESRIATTDMNIRFLAPARSGIRVRAQVIKRGRTLVPVNAELWDESGALVALAQVTYMRLGAGNCQSRSGERISGPAAGGAGGARHCAWAGSAGR